MHQIISAKKFSIQIDESIDVQIDVQLMLIILYKNPDNYFEEFSLCRLLFIITGLHIFKKS
jgi:hypothetical protein